MRNNTIARSSLGRIGLAIALTVGAGASQAACEPGDIKGVWYATGIGTGPVNNLHDDVSFTTYCKVIVNAGGAFSKESSFCKSSIGETAIEGTMRLVPSCLVRSFQIDVFDKATLAPLVTQTVDYMSLNNSKDVFAATGNKRSATTGLPQFQWTGVKR